jgi:hypothetical protein
MDRADFGRGLVGVRFGGGSEAEDAAGEAAP